MIRFISTRGAAPPVEFAQALRAGLAPDGGLYVPARIPQVTLPSPDAGLPAFAQSLLAPFVEDTVLQSVLPSLCAEAFNFDAPLRPLATPDVWLLELFHGPTAAFKDYAARFLAGALGALRAPAEAMQTILVATSGDTGAAVAAAFWRRPGFAVVILYPDGRVSPRQAHGLECWGDNVRVFRVAGTFDDCQRMVKAALADADLRHACRLTSANSISLGRLLPQAAYHAHAAARFHADKGQQLNLIIPTGNLGNAGAAWLARAMGAPIGDIMLATNANPTLVEFFAGGDYHARDAIATLANAMDVGAPSNFERLLHWTGGAEALRGEFQAMPVDDATIRETIRNAPARDGVVPCPHTACGLHVLHALRASGDARPWAVAATAHAAKFDTIVEPLVGHAIPLPPALAECLARPASGAPMQTDQAALAGALRNPLETL